MSTIKVDVNNPEALERPVYEPLEPGDYYLEITNDLVVLPSKNPAQDGKNYGRIEVQLKEEQTGKTVKDYISMSPKMAWRKNRFVLSAGVAESAEGEVDLAEFKGRTVKATVKQETYTRQDNTVGLSNKIDNYLY
jgi:hypothetical protein